MCELLATVLGSLHIIRKTHYDVKHSKAGRELNTSRISLEMNRFWQTQQE